jgi:electron transfer flavoprotein alpha subunit
VNQHKGVMVFSETYDLTLEMLGKGRELADKVQAHLSVVLIGNNVQEEASELIRYGADKVYVGDHPTLQNFQAEPYLSLLHKVVADNPSEIILIGSTRNGKPLAARLAERLNAGCVPDCIGLSINDGGMLVGDRITYGGNAMARIVFKSKPQVATVPPRAFEKPAPQERKGEIVMVNANAEAPKVEVLERKSLEASSVRVEEAEIIVSCGRGLEKKDDVALLQDLAEVLGGQVGCSRPLVEDRKWFQEWIGLSGHKVKPKLYIASGVSGVIQHVAGIRGSKVIVAINKDPEAPIFEIADYGVVGNLYEVLPALKEAMKRQLQ